MSTLRPILLSPIIQRKINQILYSDKRLLYFFGDSNRGSIPLGSKNLMLSSFNSHPGIGRPSTLLVLS